MASNRLALEPAADSCHHVEDMIASQAMLNELRRRLHAKPDDDILLYQLAEVGKRAALDETIAWFASRLESPPLSPALRLNELHIYAELRERAGRRDAGLSLTNAAGLSDLDFRFAREELATAARAASAFLAAYPDSQGAAVILAEALTSCGELRLAEKVYASLRALPAGDVTTVTNFDPAFHAGLGSALDTSLPKLPVLTVLREPGPGASRLVLTCADHLYFQKYGWQFVDSFVRRGGSTAALILHIMDMTPAEADAAVQELGRRAGLNWGLSTEWTGLRDGDRMRAKNYYHAVRFARFWQLLLRHPAAALFMLDADTIFNGDIGALFDLLDGSDLALLLSPARFEARNKVVASCTGAANSAAARDYLRDVAGYVASYWEKGRLAWGIDQVAMYAVLALRRTPLRAASIPDRLIDESTAPDKLLWAAKAIEA